MRMANVVGTVTLNRCHPSFQGARLKLVIPKSLANLTGSSRQEHDTLVAWDEQGAGFGSEVAIAEGPEASQPFRPDMKAVDCYVSAILDQVSLDPQAVQQINLSSKSNMK
ncbi:MAG: EutN/CcmL family microcompartment protein [Planctomycetota bacterium]|nr:EutN/CcmL family microcompartment protein [Planctomycetota bacterium]